MAEKLFYRIPFFVFSMYYATEKKKKNEREKEGRKEGRRKPETGRQADMTIMALLYVPIFWMLKAKIK